MLDKFQVAIRIKEKTQQKTDKVGWAGCGLELKRLKIWGAGFDATRNPLNSTCYHGVQAR